MNDKAVVKYLKKEDWDIVLKNLKNAIEVIEEDEGFFGYGVEKESFVFASKAVEHVQKYSHEFCVVCNSVNVQ